MNKDFVLDLRELLVKYNVDLAVIVDEYSHEIHIAAIDCGLEEFTDEQCHLYVDNDYINADLLDSLLQNELENKS